MVWVPFYGQLLYLQYMPSPFTLLSNSHLSLLHHKIFPLLDYFHQHIMCYLSLMLKIKTILDSTYLTSYYLISLFFTRKYFEWYILVIFNFSPLFLVESPLVRNPCHYIEIDFGEFTNGFCVAKSNQSLVFILLDLSVLFNIILFLLLENLSLLGFQDTNTYLAYFPLFSYMFVFLAPLHLPGL